MYEENFTNNLKIGFNLSEVLKTTVCKLMEKYQSFEASELFRITASFKHQSIEYLHETFGYNRSILKLVSWIMDWKKVEITNDTMNEYFWECMQERIFGCGEIIKQWVDNLDRMEVEISELLKNVSNRYLTCYICNENRVSVLYLPCGHLIVCPSCHDKSVKYCQACDSVIGESHTVYM